MTEKAKPEQQSPGKAMIASIDYSGPTGIVGDGVEIAVDSILQDSPIRDIPIIGWIAGIWKTGASIKEAWFARKVMHFLKELDALTAHQKQKALKGLNQEENEDRIGETLFLFLNAAKTR